MSTPPNSFCSDIRFITPGSTDNDEFEDLESKLYKSYLEKESKKFFMSAKKFEYTLHKDFDVLKANIEHQTVSVKCGGKEEHIINVDILIAPLVELINKEELLTTQSCQYNNSGYSYISFTLEGWQKWCNKVIKKAIEKYGNDSYYDCDILERFMFNDIQRKMELEKYKDRTINNLIVFESGIYHGVQEFLFGVTWMFLQEDIEYIYTEIKELFE